MTHLPFQSASVMRLGYHSKSMILIRDRNKNASGKKFLISVNQIYILQGVHGNQKFQYIIAKVSS